MPEEETVIELETLADDLADVEAEEGVNPYGESISGESEVDYQAIASQAIDAYILESLQDK